MADTTVEQRLDALEGRVARIEGLTEVVTGIRADIATIAEGIDPAIVARVTELEAEVAAMSEAERIVARAHSDPTRVLARDVAELADTVENHGLLLARLLEKDAE